MAPNASPTTSPRRPTSSLSSSGYSSDGGFIRPDFATPPHTYGDYSGWNKNNSYRNPFDYTDSVKEMDRQLEKIRKKPSKIINDPKKFVAVIDMSNFKPEDIEVIFETGLLTIKAEHEVKLNETTSITKIFTRKFTIPEDVRGEMIATELSPTGMLTITALRHSN
uniref:SHSP domain-containing protein n=1 Tax=Panagrolaimus sp. JU765 TaxID=591449 RepID=A0AC34RAG0_9BILA